MTHDETRDLSTEYVLGALTGADRAALEQHLAGCAECRAYVAADAHALDAVGRGVAQVSPPAALRARVLGAATAPAVTPIDSRGALPTAAAPASRAGMAPWLLAAAAILVAVVTGWQYLAARAERDQIRADYAQQLETQRASLEGQRASLESQLAEQQRSAAVLAAPDLVRFDLNASDPLPSARARAFWSHRHGMVFTADGLAELPSDRTYQLWVISGGKPISAGIFSTSAAGQARIVMPTPETLTQVEAVAVTVEPAGGLSQPSTTPVLVGAAAA